jgi:TP901 family phage tail tape measure protein
MPSQREIDIVIQTRDRASAELKKLSAELGALGKSAGAPTKALDGLFGAIKQGIGIAGGFAVFNKVQDALSGAAGSAIGFEKSMSGIKAVSGASAGDMQQLSTLALQLGKDTSFSAGQAAKGIEELLKGGVSIGDVFGGAASAALNLAAAGEVDLASAAEIAANAMSQFGLSGADMENVSNKIAGAANASSLSVNDFKFSLSAVGSVAALAGESFDSTAVAIAQLGAAGIKGSDAGTSLKAMLNTLIPTTDAAKSAMKDLGIITATGANQFIDASGKMKDFGAIAEILQTSTGKLTESQRLLALETIFGADGMRAAGVLAKGGAEGFNTMAASMDKVTAASVAAERLNNLAGDLEQLKGSAETAGIILLSTLSPALRDAAKKATEFVNGFTQEAQTIVRTAENISREHGIGMVDAAVVAIEDRLRETWGPAWADAFHAAKEQVDKIPLALEKVQTSIGGVITKLGEMKTAVDSSRTASNTLDTALDAIKGTVVGLLAAGALGGLLTLLGNIGARAGLLAAGFGPLGIAAAIVGAAWSTNFGHIQEGVQNQIKGFQELGRVLGYVFGEAGKGFGDMKAEFLGWVDAITTAIRTAGPQWAAAAQQAGKDMVAGVAGALWDGRTSVIGVAAALGQQAISALRQAVEAHSPSRLAMEIGRDIVDGLGMGMSEDLSPVEQAAAEMAEKVEDATRAHGYRMEDLERKLGEARGKERERVLERIRQEEENHGRRLESIAEGNADRVVELERDQARRRLGALTDFTRGFADLTDEVEAKSREIGERVAEALRTAGDEASKGVRDAIDRAHESIDSLNATRTLNLEIRGRQDTFSGEQDLRERIFRAQREDAEQAYRWERDKEKAQLKFKADIAKAKTDEEREQIGQRLTAETQAADAAYEDAKKERDRRLGLDAEEREFRKAQDAARRVFEDTLENEALQRQIARINQERDDRITAINTALDEKDRAILASEAKEREALAASYGDKVQDLKEKFLDKVGPLLDGQRAALNVFLDDVAKKAGETSAKIIAASAAAASALATMATGAGGGGDTSAAQAAVKEAQRIINAPTSITLPGMDRPATNAELVQAGVLKPGERLQNFGGGGVVSGPSGAAQLVMAHAGETVFTPEQLAALGRGQGGGNLTVILEVDRMQWARAMAPYITDEQSREVRIALR